MTVILSIMLAAFVQSTALQTEREPFRVDVGFSADAARGDAWMVVVAERPIADLSIRNHTAGIAFELDPAVEGPWLVIWNAAMFRLSDLFPVSYLPAGANRFSVSVLATDGARTIVQDIEVIVR